MSVGFLFVKPAVSTSTPPEIIYDSNGIPSVYYGEQIGYQGNPVTTSLRLMYYQDNFHWSKNATILQYIKSSSNWLIINAKQYGSYSLYEYSFPFRYNVVPPWHSALAQGLAIQALLKSYQITQNETYLNQTIPLLNSFYVDVKYGGITLKTDNQGWWYEEYASSKGENPRVLNGMMYDLVALYEYYNYTGNSKAKFLFDQGVVSLKNNISTYDANGSSYYDSQRSLLATPYYQKVHVDLLGKLYAMTGESVFKQYRDKWEIYLESYENKSTSIPEFGILSGMIVIISLIGSVVISKKYRL